MTAVSRRFVVPRRGVSTVCLLDRGKIEEVGPVPMPLLARHAVDHASGWLAYLADEGRQIGLIHLDAEPHEQNFPPLAMPGENVVAHSLAFHRGVLYVGGVGSKEMLGRFDLHDAAPAWKPLAIPPELQRANKSIDELLIDGERLIAVDDCVEPKWLLVYDLAEPGRPLIERAGIYGHGVNETVCQGALGASWVALLSTSCDMGGSHRMISLLDRPQLYSCGGLIVEDGLSSWHPHSREGAMIRSWHQVAFLGDILLLAAGRDGLGVLDLSSIARYEVGTGGHQGLDLEECVDRLAYQPVPGCPPGELIHITPLPEVGEVMGVVRSDSGHDLVLLAGLAAEACGRG